MSEIDNIIDSIKISCVRISEEISYMDPLNKSNIVSKNSSNVKSLDLICNELMIEELLKNSNISEENDFRRCDSCIWLLFICW